jgi:Flp pilus assembly protein TadG
MPHAHRRAASGRRTGSVTVWLVVCLSVILGILALGVDGGRMMEERRRVQAAADAAALAAAADLSFNYSQNAGLDPAGTAQAAALAGAAANGYGNNGTTSTVTVNIPPQSGTFAGQAEYVEVIVLSNLQGTFSALFTQGPLPVRGRAVAHGSPLKIGLLLLSSGADALQLNGNASVQVSGASIQVDSTSSSAYDLSGNASVSAASNNVAGSTAPNGNISGTINTGVPPTPDPLLALAAPDPGSYPTQAASATSVGSGTTVTLQPGVYQGGISISGTGSVALAPGIYILNGGGLQVSGNGSLSGSGVMIYNTGGSSAGAINISGNGTINLTPPTSGPYQGISIFQDRSVTQTVQLSGNGSVQVTGAVYAAAATIQLSGNASSGSTVGGGFIAARVTASGNGQFTVQQGTNRPRIPDVELVE